MDRLNGTGWDFFFCICLGRMSGKRSYIDIVNTVENEQMFVTLSSFRFCSE